MDNHNLQHPSSLASCTLVGFRSWKTPAEGGKVRGEEGRDVSSPRLLPQDHNLHCIRSSGLPGACASPDLLLLPLTSPLRKSPLSERLNPSEASERPPARCPTSSQNREMTRICIGKNSLGLHGPTLSRHVVGCSYEREECQRQVQI